MKGTRKQYEQVKQLPATAQSVANYAASKSITVSYVYKLNSKGEVKIVDFQGYNFVIVN